MPSPTVQLWRHSATCRTAWCHSRTRGRTRSDGMPDREPRAHGASDLMLVLGIAAVALGVGMMNRGMLPSQSAVHLVPPTHAAPDQVERLAPAPDPHSVAD